MIHCYVIAYWYTREVMYKVATKLRGGVTSVNYDYIPCYLLLVFVYTELVICSLPPHLFALPHRCA